MARRPEPEIPMTREELAALQAQFKTMSDSAIQSFNTPRTAGANLSIACRPPGRFRSLRRRGSTCGVGSGDEEGGCRKHIGRLVC